MIDSKECSRDSPFHCFLRLFFLLSSLPRGKIQAKGSGRGVDCLFNHRPQKERFLSRAWGLKHPSRAPRAHLGLGGGGREDSSPSFSSRALAEPQDLTGFPSPASHACLMPSTPPSAGREAGPLRNSQKKSRRGPPGQAGLGVLGRGGGPRWASTQS